MSRSTSVFYPELEPGTNGGTPVRKSARLPGAKPASFRSLESGYAADADQVYYKNRVLPDAPAIVRVLGLGYAKSDTRVYYSGELIPGADAASFTLLEPPTDMRRPVIPPRRINRGAA